VWAWSGGCQQPCRLRVGRLAASGGKDRKAVARLGRSIDDGGQGLERLEIKRAATSTGGG